MSTTKASTAKEVKTTTPKKKKKGLRAAQVRILNLLAKAKGGLGRKYIAENAPCDRAWLNSWIGSYRDEIRLKRPSKNNFHISRSTVSPDSDWTCVKPRSYFWTAAKDDSDYFPSLLTLGYVDYVEGHTERGKALYEITPAGRKAIASAAAVVVKPGHEPLLHELEAFEGAQLRAEAKFRQRNRTLIEAKRAASDGRCGVCGFSFPERYVGLERDCLVCHHLEPIGTRPKAMKTTLNDVEMLCPNCHAAAHTQDPPIDLEHLRRMMVS